MKSGIDKRLGRAAEDFLGDIFGKYEQERKQDQLREIRKNPKAHRLTLLFPPGSRATYRYADGGRDHTGRTVRFCWSVHRNAAGFFLAWKQLRADDGRGERVGWSAHEKKYAAKAWAERWCADWKAQRRGAYR